MCQTEIKKTLCQFENKYKLILKSDDLFSKLNYLKALIMIYKKAIAELSLNNNNFDYVIEIILSNSSIRESLIQMLNSYYNAFESDFNELNKIKK